MRNIGNWCAIELVSFLNFHQNTQSSRCTLGYQWQQSPQTVSSIAVEFRSRGECRQCGLPPQHPDLALNVRNGPFMPNGGHQRCSFSR